jgi:hypothetical protein
MPIPDFQSLMLPIMKIAQDGEEHRGHELRQRIGEPTGPNGRAAEGVVAERHAACVHKPNRLGTNTSHYGGSPGKDG